MKLIDDLVEAFKEHERVSVEYTSALQEIDCLSDIATIRDQEIFDLKAINEIQKNRLTELAVEVDDAKKLVDQVRIVLFDVVGMYNKLEAANDAE